MSGGRFKSTTFFLVAVLSVGSGSASAQEGAKDSPASIRQEVERLVRAWDDAWNEKNATALAALFTEDGVFLAPIGAVAHGRDAIAKLEAKIMKGFGDDAMVANHVDQAEPLPNGAWAIGHFTVTGASAAKGHWAAVYVREAGQLKGRMLTGAIEPVPPARPAGEQIAAGQDSDVRLVAASNLKWSPARGLPAGAQSALLAGNPAKERAFVLRLKMPANYRIPPHHHPVDEAVTVLSGEVSVGTGDKVDKATAKTMKPGDFVLLPAGVNHFAWARKDSVIEVHSTGPFGATYANPADDPMKAR